MDELTIDAFIQVFKALGVPGTLLFIVGYTIRRVVKWATPVVENCVAAYISRQKTMEACHEKLTAGTLEIQRENQAALKQLHERLPSFCNARQRKPFPPKPSE